MGGRWCGRGFLSPVVFEDGEGFFPLLFVVYAGEGVAVCEGFSAFGW